MQIKAQNPEEYLAQLPENRKEVIAQLRETVLNNIPAGFQETMNYGMIGYVVPHSVYPKGYHCDPKQPLPFINIASQKNYISFYHMGLYANPELLSWFEAEYPKYCKSKLDKGRGCIRFKKPEEIPYTLIGELVKKFTTENWIKLYENAFNKK